MARQGGNPGVTGGIDRLARAGIASQCPAAAAGTDPRTWLRQAALAEHRWRSLHKYLAGATDAGAMLDHLDGQRLRSWHLAPLAAWPLAARRRELRVLRASPSLAGDLEELWLSLASRASRRRTRSSSAASWSRTAAFSARRRAISSSRVVRLHCAWHAHPTELLQPPTEKRGCETSPNMFTRIAAPFHRVGLFGTCIGAAISFCLNMGHLTLPQCPPVGHTI